MLRMSDGEGGKERKKTERQRKEKRDLAENQYVLPKTASSSRTLLPHYLSLILSALVMCVIGRPASCKLILVSTGLLILVSIY